MYKLFFSVFVFLSSLHLVFFFFFEACVLFSLFASFMSCQAAFTSTGPEPLYNILIEAGFDEQHGKVRRNPAHLSFYPSILVSNFSLSCVSSQVVGKLWAAEAAGFIGKLKDRSIHTSTLQSSDYRLNLLMATGGLSRLAEPTALFEFNILDSSSSSLGRDVSISA